jgi:acetyl-CoA acetyltransferase family protein
VDAARTPFGRLRGALSGVRADDLAAIPIRALADRHPMLGEDGRVDDLILGNTIGLGEDSGNLARLAGLLAGLPTSVPGSTVNRLCAAGGEAVIQAARAVRTGDADLVIAGGVDSMSRAPLVLPLPEEPFPSALPLLPTEGGWRMVNPRMPSSWTIPLAACADGVAVTHRISRQQQDEWAAQSQERAASAWQKRHHDGFVVPVNQLIRDEPIRPGTNPRGLAMIRPAMPGGTVTAGNSPPFGDGATAILVGSERAVAELGVAPLGTVVASATVAVEPDKFPLAPVPAVMRALTRAGLTANDIALWEINEAYAAMVLACQQVLSEQLGHRLAPERVNPNGGAIALGHPLGASMPRVIVDTCRELARQGGGYGVATSCSSVGHGVAVVVRVD